jgi:hypothetical protein
MAAHPIVAAMLVVTTVTAVIVVASVAAVLIPVVASAAIMICVPRVSKLFMQCVKERVSPIVIDGRCCVENVPPPECD